MIIINMLIKTCPTAGKKHTAVIKHNICTNNKALVRPGAIRNGAHLLSEREEQKEGDVSV